MTVPNRMQDVLCRLDASIRVEGSHSRAIADLVEQEWRNAHPEEPIIRRHIRVDPIRTGRQLGAAVASAAAVRSGTPPRSPQPDPAAA